MCYTRKGTRLPAYPKMYRDHQSIRCTFFGTASRRCERRWQFPVERGTA